MIYPYTYFPSINDAGKDLVHLIPEIFNILEGQLRSFIMDLVNTIPRIVNGQTIGSQHLGDRLNPFLAYSEKTIYLRTTKTAFSASRSGIVFYIEFIRKTTKSNRYASKHTCCIEYLIIIQDREYYVTLESDFATTSKIYLSKQKEKL